MTGLAKNMTEKVLRFVAGQASMPAVPSVFLSLGVSEGEAFTEASSRVQIAGPLITNGATSTSSTMLNHASIPSWIAAGMQAYNETTRQVVGLVQSVGDRQIVLAEPSACPISSGHTITYTTFAGADGAAVNRSAVAVVAGDANAWALFDAPSGGNILWCAGLGEARAAAIAAGAQLILPPGSLKLSMEQSAAPPQAPAEPTPVAAPAAPAPTPLATLSRAPSGRTAVARA